MKADFFFGPDKAPVIILDNGMVGGNSAIPFHGIISRGLLNAFIRLNIDREVWYKFAPLLEQTTSEVNGQDFSDIRALASECRVLSFGQSAWCVKKYVEQRVEISDHTGKCEIWNIKEGHTSSVWKVSLPGSKRKNFIVNVARDHEAGLELKVSSEKMQIIKNSFNDCNLATVEDIGSIQLSSGSDLWDVVVVRNEWIENGYEIHEKFSHQSNNKQYLLVDRFLTSPDNPVHITSVLGRVLTAQESAMLESDMADFIHKAGSCISSSPGINVNDGDIVWNGHRAIVVAMNQ